MTLSDSIRCQSYRQSPSKYDLEEWEELHRALRLLIEAIQKEHYKTGEIEDI
jgi:hypothetical protein